ncbi:MULTISPECIES: retropepsin-like aspartic protease [Pseudomonas]|uniref:retropepsin-like aspartic protease n=1 Tax=Pseudomonas TaxID=286 RepID=UPI001F51B9B1|nr:MULTISPECIES: retropepsin-like aspartic protease [Pseudomonas]
MKTFALPALFASTLWISTGLLSAVPANVPVADQDFYQWLETGQGRDASLAQLRQQCDKVLDADKHLSCSVTVLARMLEAKAANQIPEYYLAIKGKHARAIAADADLNALFSMFGSESLAILTRAGNFSVKGSARHEVLQLHPYANDFYIAEQSLPFIEVGTANGVSARFVLDTGAPQTRVNIETAKQMGIRMLPDAHYRYSTFYGERGLAARLGILGSLRVGTREFRNVLVFVSARDNLLGLDLISKLGRLKITRRTLELNPPPARRCDAPIVLSRLDLNQRLVVAAQLDRRTTQAIIDTGNVDYLTAASPGGQENAVQALTPGSSNVYTGDKKHFQRFDGVLVMQGNIMAVTYKYYPGFTIPPSLMGGQYVPTILLGWRAFKDFELNLDLDSGRSCLNRV